MSADTPASFTIASYNVHSCVGMDRVYDPGRVLGVIRDLDADIVGLQEVHSRRRDNWTQSPLDYFAEETNWATAFAPTVFHDDGDYGNAVVTRWPVIATREHVIYEPRPFITKLMPGAHARGVLEVDIDVAGVVVRVLVTHFGLLPWERRWEVRHLLEVIDARATPVTILMGDFNVWWPWAYPVRMLRKKFPGMPALRTLPSKRPVLAVDRLFVAPRTALQSMSVHTSDRARAASDHLPLRAELALRT